MTAPDAQAPSVAGVANLILPRVEDFAECLRAAGLGVTVGETASAIEALACLAPDEVDDLYWGLRMALVNNETEIERFDRLFREYWLGLSEPGGPDEEPEDGSGQRSESGPPDEGREPGIDADAPVRWAPSTAPGAERGEDEPDPAEFAAYSAVERLRGKNFAEYDDDDFERLTAGLEHLDLSGPQRRSRRYRRHRKGPLDFRRTIVAGFKTDGYPIRRQHHRRRLVTRPIVFVCDVSGSMQQYAMPILLLAHAMARRRGAVATFAFATRLHLIDRELDTGNAKSALAAVVERVVDWSGGTRVGECLYALNRRYRSYLRGASVVIASDGWDLGDMALLRAQMDQLRLVAHEIVWLNPNLQDQDFEPLTKGMANALPFVDHLISCHAYASFEELVRLLADAPRR